MPRPGRGLGLRGPQAGRGAGPWTHHLPQGQPRSQVGPSSSDSDTPVGDSGGERPAGLGRGATGSPCPAPHPRRVRPLTRCSAWRAARTPRARRLPGLGGFVGWETPWSSSGVCSQVLGTGGSSSPGTGASAVTGHSHAGQRQVPAAPGGTWGAFLLHPPARPCRPQQSPAAAPVSRPRAAGPYAACLQAQRSARPHPSARLRPSVHHLRPLHQASLAPGDPLLTHPPRARPGGPGGL